MERGILVTSRGVHYEAFAVSRVHVFVVTRRELAASEIAGLSRARRSIEELYPDGHVVIADLRQVEGLFGRETRAAIAEHVRVQRAGHVRARAVVLPENPVLAHVLRAFMLAYFQAPGVKCPTSFVSTLEAACEFVGGFIQETIEISTIVDAACAIRAGREPPSSEEIEA